MAWVDYTPPKIIRTVLTDEETDKPLANVVIEMVIVPYWTDIDGAMVEPDDPAAAIFIPGGLLAVGETDKDGRVDWVLGYWEE